MQLGTLPASGIPCISAVQKFAGIPRAGDLRLGARPVRCTKGPPERRCCSARVDRLLISNFLDRAAVDTTRSSKIIHVVTCHAGGEVGDVIVGGVAPAPGETLWELSRFIAKDGALRNFVLNEPGGGVFRHVNLLVPAKDLRAQMGFIIMEPEDTPPMSGPNSICVATVLLDAGILLMQEPETRLTLEAPGGLIAVAPECRNGLRPSRARAASGHNVIDGALECGKIEWFPQRRLCAVSRIYAVLPVARRQRQRQAAGHQGLDEWICIVLAKRHVDDRRVDFALGQFESVGQIVRRANHVVP
jgi:hypothetical protein